jgi:hypothetical protein
LAAAAAALLTAGVVGCASFDAALGKREAVVQFAPQTPSRVMLAVRAACSHVPAARPEALPPHPLAASAVYDVRFLVSSASDADLARLQQCLERFPSVAGIVFTSPGDS